MPQLYPDWRYLLPPGPSRSRYGTQDVADILGVSPDLVRDWLARKWLVGRRHWPDFRGEPNVYSYEIKLRAVERALRLPGVQADIWRYRQTKAGQEREARLEVARVSPRPPKPSRRRSPKPPPR